MNEEKTKLPSFRNLEWEKSKKRNRKDEQTSPIYPNRDRPNNLIYAGTKTVSMKFKEKERLRKKKDQQNTWAVSLIRYSEPFISSSKEELRNLDQKTRKLMTMHYTQRMILTDSM